MKFHKLEFVDKWSNLVPDLLVEIAIKLKIIEDFTAFRGVCTSWRAAVAENNFKGLLLDKAPLLMLADQNKYQDNNEREFYSLSTRKIHKAAVSEAKSKKCMDAEFGWIVAEQLSSGEVDLFNPFYSSRIFQLPNSHNFTRYGTFPLLQKAILTANPSETSDFMVLVLMDGVHVLGFWKNGDTNWTMIRSEVPDPGTEISSIVYCGDKMYAIYNDGSLWSWNPSATQMDFVLRLDNFLCLFQVTYMVESTAGELLLITRNKSRVNFEVARISVVKRKWKQIYDIGGDAIFLGQKATLSVADDDLQGVIKPNCIYFTNKYKYWYQRGRSGMPIYDIGKGTVEWCSPL